MKKVFLICLLVLLLSVAAMAGGPHSKAADHPWGGDQVITIATADHPWGGDEQVILTWSFWTTLLRLI